MAGVVWGWGSALPTVAGDGWGRLAWTGGDTSGGSGGRHESKRLAARPGLSPTTSAGAAGAAQVTSAEAQPTGLRLTHDVTSDGTTTLRSPGLDEAALHGVLVRVRDPAPPSLGHDG